MGAGIWPRRLSNRWAAGARTRHLEGRTPNIDLLTPNIYLPTFAETTQLYTRSDNPLFIPESKADSAGAANAFYAIGRHGDGKTRRAKVWDVAVK